MYGWDELFWAVFTFGVFLYAVLHAPAKKDDKKDDKKDKKPEKKEEKKDDKPSGPPRLKPETIKAAMPKSTKLPTKATPEKKK